jgi:hypothetical protein
MTSPVDLIPDSKGEISSACQHEANDARVIVIETGIVRGDHGIVLRGPLQFANVPHSTGDDRVAIHGAIFDRTQRVLLRVNQTFAAGFGCVAIGF